VGKVQVDPVLTIADKVLLEVVRTGMNYPNDELIYAGEVDSC
jgi:hypothetical protein